MDNLLMYKDFFLLAVLSASLSLSFHQFMEDGMIFQFYADFLRKLRYGKAKWKKMKFHTEPTDKNKFWAYLSKPLGLCPHCSGTWIGIGIYLIYLPIGIDILLFIGINWLLIKIGLKTLFNQ